MKIKITKAIISAGKVLKKDSIHDLDESVAGPLVKSGHAQTVTEPNVVEPKQPEAPSAPTVKEAK
ncbi:MAG TPA: hypothetical protein PKA41_07945 [Verrucomicrobiota bacterium]|nr:hypothetical protein [Verrucomicrobiota bacterium]